MREGRPSHEGRGLKRRTVGPTAGWNTSPLTRGARIETGEMGAISKSPLVAPHTRGAD